MNRPSVTQLPTKRLTLTDLRNERETKKNSLFNTRLLPAAKNILVPNVSSKSLNNKLLKLYPGQEQTSERSHKIAD